MARNAANVLIFIIDNVVPPTEDRAIKALRSVVEDFRYSPPEMLKSRIGWERVCEGLEEAFCNYPESDWLARVRDIVNDKEKIPDSD